VGKAETECGGGCGGCVGGWVVSTHEKMRLLVLVLACACACRLVDLCL
jgi:hypothetical protein